MAQEMARTRTRDYVQAGGLRTYYETEGEGEPLVLLHGGLWTVETMEAQTQALSARYRERPERRGHGRTADVAGPITYEAMAADTIAFLEAMQMGRAHLVGWSDGAVVALRVALDRPDLVGKLVFIGNYASLDGARPDQIALMDAMTRAVMPPRRSNSSMQPCLQMALSISQSCSISCSLSGEATRRSQRPSWRPCVRRRSFSWATTTA